MPTKSPLEQRSYCFEVRAEDSAEFGSIITGRPIVYDQKTDLGYFDEIIETEAGTTIGCHCGPNTLGVLFIEK